MMPNKREFFLHQVPVSSCCTRMCLKEGTKKPKYVFQDSFSFSCQEIGAEMKCFSSHFYALCAIHSETIFSTSFRMKFFFFFRMCDIIAPCCLIVTRKHFDSQFYKRLSEEVVKGSKAQRTKKGEKLHSIYERVRFKM